jgi:hypothetical protein
MFLYFVSVKKKQVIWIIKNLYKHNYQYLTYQP